MCLARHQAPRTGAFFMPSPDSPDSPAVRTPQDVQPPLGPAPDYDAVLDLAVEYSFPCSDPIAVDGCCAEIAKRTSAQEQPPLEPSD
jgi:hypothetical protein